MVNLQVQRLSCDDWIREALDVLDERGIDGVKIIVIAEAKAF